MATRPVGQHGTGFFCIGKTLYDANGNEFRIRGTNDIGFWRGGIDLDTNLLPSYRQAKFNAVRIPFAPFSADGIPRATKSQAFIDSKIIPIPVAFSAFGDIDSPETTGSSDPANLAAVVDGWLADGAWLRSKERYLILNIANEWGPASTVWRDSYITQIARLRGANINCTIMVDAGGSGEASDDIENFAQAIFDADSEHNVVFSIHIYGALWTEAAPESWQYGLNPRLAALGAMNVPVIVGEFSSLAYNAAQGWQAIDPAHVIAQCEANGLGYLGWQWYNDSPENEVIDAGGGNNPTVYTGSSAQLTAFGVALVKNATEPLATQASVFGGGMTINSSLPTPTMSATMATVAATTLAITSTLATPTMAASMATSVAANDLAIASSLPAFAISATLGAPENLAIAASLPPLTMAATMGIPTTFAVTASLPSLVALFSVGIVQFGTAHRRGSHWPFASYLTEAEFFRDFGVKR